MKIQLGGGRAVTVSLAESDRINVNGMAYPTHCSLCFFEGRGGEQVEVFATREQLGNMAHAIINAMPTEEPAHGE